MALTISPVRGKSGVKFVANILAKLVGEQQTFLGGQIHNRLIGILNFRIGNERLQAHADHLAPWWPSDPVRPPEGRASAFVCARIK